MSDLRFRLGGRGLRGLRMRLSSRATGASHEGAAGGKGGGRAASVSHVRRSYGCSKTSMSHKVTATHTLEALTSSTLNYSTTPTMRWLHTKPEISKRQTPKLELGARIGGMMRCLGASTIAGLICGLTRLRQSSRPTPCLISEL